MRILTLDEKGVVAAILLGAALFAFGTAAVMLGSTATVFKTGYAAAAGGLLYLIGMLWFLVLAAISTNAWKRKKKKLGLYEESRGYMNVAANGLGPLAFAVVGVVCGFLGYRLLYWGAVVGFIASLAAITADKFSSEIGVLGGQPVMIFTFERVKKGISGGISGLGLAAGLGGAALAALLVFSFAPVFGLPAVVVGFFVITISGFVGTITDSMLGFYENKNIGNKHTSNYISSLVGGLWGMALFMLFIAIIH